MKIAIYGPGGFGRELIPVANHGADELCFISDERAAIGTMVEGLQVYSLEQVVELEADRRADHAARGAAGSPFEPLGVVIAVADAGIRTALADKVQHAGLRQGSIIAPNAIVGPGVTIGEGAVLCHFTTVTASTRIGRHFHANIYSYVAHDCVVGDFVTLAPRVCVNGNTIIEDEAYVGTGAVLKQGTPEKPLRIGSGAVIGMGAVVTKDVAPGAVVIGNPARPMGA